MLIIAQVVKELTFMESEGLLLCSLVPILSHMKPIDTFTSYIFKIHFNSKRYLSFRFSNKVLYPLLMSLMYATYTTKIIF